jgi:hypothetical protein
VQVHDFLPEEEEKLRLRGHFYAVISVHVQDPNLDNIALGREILTRLHEEYFGRLELSAFEALKGAIAKVSFEASSFSGVKSVEIAAGAFVENALYTAVQGQTQAAIFRNNIMANILIGQDEKTTSASGYPQEGDVFLLGTKLFFDIFSEEIVKNALKDKSLDRVAESLAPTISSAKDAEQIGAVFISFNHQEEWLNHVNFNHLPVSEEPRSKAVSLGLMARLKTIAGGIMQKLRPRVFMSNKGEEPPRR